jgi:non-canonical (house-cleaning) NTP pyrophosphatase
MQNEKKLLNEVSEKLRNFEESQKKEGGIFNIFSITKIERREVDTHSAMIAELLNPRNSDTRM